MIRRYAWEGSLLLILGFILHMFIFAFIIFDFEGSEEKSIDPEIKLSSSLKIPQALTMLFVSVAYNGAIISDKFRK